MSLPPQSKGSENQDPPTKARLQGFKHGAAVLGGIVALGAAIWQVLLNPTQAKLPLAYALAMGIGGLVSAVEIFQRYRAEPLQALSTRWGWLYVGFNSAVAALAFAVADLSQNLGPGTATYSLLQWAAGAGFGSAVLLRSKLLNLDLGDGRTAAIGPEIVVQTFLAIIDRELDRSRATLRFNTVRRLFTGIDFERSKLRLPLEVFQAMQGVTEEESKTLMQRIAEVDAMTALSDQDKAYQLGFLLLDLVGERFLDDVLSRYKDEFSQLPAAPPAAAPGGSPPPPPPQAP